MVYNGIVSAVTFGLRVALLTSLPATLEEARDRTVEQMISLRAGCGSAMTKRKYTYSPQRSSLRCGIAQMAERENHNLEAEGSSPSPALAGYGKPAN